MKSIFTSTPIYRVVLLLSLFFTRGFKSTTMLKRCFIMDRRYFGTDRKSVQVMIDDPTSILNAIASNYRNLNRIIMEFVDNSVDSDDVRSRKIPNEKHPILEIHANIDLDRRNIWIRDSGPGMGEAELLRLINGIGRSVKRDSPGLNGQFGFGVHAFRAAADKLVVYSTTLADPSIVRNVNLFRNCSAAEAPEDRSLDDVYLNDPLVSASVAEDIFSSTNSNLFPHSGTSGTVIGILNIDPVW